MARLLFALLLVLALAPAARAEPYMAVREGYSCGQCHINHTGGGMRSELGVVYAQTALPAASWTAGGDAVSQFVASGLSSAIRVGANLRVNDTTVLAATSTFNGNEIGSVKTQNAFSVPEGNLYLKLDVLPQHVSLYLDQTVAPFVGVREAFVLAEGGPGGLYAKAGQILQPFGVRLLDDDTSTRTVTQFRYDTSQLGVEVGLDHKPNVISLAVTDSGGVGFGKKFVGSASVVMPRWRIGLSGALSDESTGDVPIRRHVGGAWGGLGLGRLSVLGEIDVVGNNVGDRDELAAFLSGDLLLTRGANLKLAFDYHDRYLGVPEDYRSRLVAGIELFPVQFVQTSLFYQARFDIPQAAAADRADRIVLQLHGFY